MHAQIPLFPLNTVLCPGGPLLLRIFEARYLDMISRCLQQSEPFGVIAIKHGSEVAAADTFAVGTLAQITDWRREADGLLGITATGHGRFAIEHASRQPDGLYVARVALWPADVAAPLPSEYEPLAALLRRLLPLCSQYRDVVADYADAAWVGYRLTEILPLPLPLKQELLESADALARLARLRENLQVVRSGNRN